MTNQTTNQQATIRPVKYTILQENYVKLMELQRDMVGYDNLVQQDREFLRQSVHICVYAFAPQI